MCYTRNEDTAVIQMMALHVYLRNSTHYLQRATLLKSRVALCYIISFILSAFGLPLLFFLYTNTKIHCLKTMEHILFLFFSL